MSGSTIEARSSHEAARAACGAIKNRIDNAAAMLFVTRFSAAGKALAFAVEFHGALADREVGGRLNLLHERRRLGVCLKLAAFGGGLVHVREDHRRRLDEVIDGVRAGLEEARV